MTKRTLSNIVPPVTRAAVPFVGASSPLIQQIRQRQMQESGSHGLPKDTAAAQKKAGGSNVGKARATSTKGQGPFCGPSGGSPKGSFPVTNAKQAASAKARAHNAPNPAGIVRCVDRVMGKKNK